MKVSFTGHTGTIGVVDIIVLSYCLHKFAIFKTRIAHNSNLIWKFTLLICRIQANICVEMDYFYKIIPKNDKN